MFKSHRNAARCLPCNTIFVLLSCMSYHLKLNSQAIEMLPCWSPCNTFLYSFHVRPIISNYIQQAIKCCYWLPCNDIFVFPSRMSYHLWLNCDWMQLFILLPLRGRITEIINILQIRQIYLHMYDVSSTTDFPCGPSWCSDTVLHVNPLRCTSADDSSDWCWYKGMHGLVFKDRVRRQDWRKVKWDTDLRSWRMLNFLQW